MSKQLDELLNRPVNLKKLIDGIAFTVEQLEEAALEQPSLYLEASRYRTLKLRKHRSRELQRDMVKAEIGLQQRKKKKDGERQTESAIKDTVTLHPDMVVAQKAMDQAEAEEEWSKGLMEVFRQRLHVINTLKDIRISEAPNVVRKVRQEMAVGQMHKAAEQARARLGIEGEQE